MIAQRIFTILAFALIPAWVAAQTIPVSTANVTNGKIDQVYTGLARVKPLLEAHPSGQFDGRIVEVFVQVGQVVSAGQSMARLTPKSAESGTSSLVLGGAGYTVVANISGVVVAQLQNLGDVVTSGTPLFTIVPETGFRITLSVPLAYADDITYASAATLHLPDGNISVTPSSVQPFDLNGTGFFPVEFAVGRSAPILGSVVDADIIVRSHDNALLIPRQAIVESNSKFFVFLLIGGKAIKTEVMLGIHSSDVVEILSGLKVGDEVITVGNFSLEDGAEVKVVAGG